MFKKKYHANSIWVYIFFIIFSLTARQATYAQVKDSLLHALKKASNDTQRINVLLALTELSDDTSIKKYFDTTITLCKKGIVTRQQPYDFYLNSLGNTYSNFGRYYQRKDEHVNALEQYKKALEVAEQLNDKKFKSNVLNNIAVAYDDLGDMKRSLEVSYEDLKLQEALKDSAGIAYTYNNIAHIFAELKDNKNALEYYTKCLKMFERIHNAHGSAMINANIGTYYSDQGDNKTALESYKKSLALYEQMGNTYFVGEILSCCGFELVKLGENDSALTYFRRALTIAEKYNVKETIAYSYTAIAGIFLKKAQMDSAQFYAVRSLALSKETGNLRDIQSSAKVLKEIYLKQNNYKDAYTMLDVEISMRDSIANEHNYKDAINKKLQYDYEKKELQLKLDNEKKILEKDIVIVSVLLVAITVASLSYFYTRHNKLRTKVERMELEQQQYRSQMNPHFIFNCLNSIQHYIVHNDVMSANKYLSEFASLMRTTMENNKLHTIALQQEIDYLNSYLMLEQMRFENKFSYEIICTPEVNVLNIQILPTIIQPFAENAIVHGLCYLESSGKLSIKFEQKGDALICSIDDNGIGRKASQEMKNKTGKTHISRGMELVNKRLSLASSLYKKKYEIEIIDKISDEGKALGTLVILKFPLDI